MRGMILRRFITRSKYNSGKDKIQNDKMQKWQNTKRQNTNMTKCKTTKCKYDKMQKDRMPIWQNTKRQFTNMTKHKKTEHKSDNTQYDKIQIWQNTNATKYKYLLLKQYRGVTIENRRAAKRTASRSAILYGPKRGLSLESDLNLTDHLRIVLQQLQLKTYSLFHSLKGYLLSWH